jgi:hypothetical protein
VRGELVLVRVHPRRGLQDRRRVPRQRRGEVNVRRDEPAVDQAEQARRHVLRPNRGRRVRVAARAAVEDSLCVRNLLLPELAQRGPPDRAADVAFRARHWLLDAKPLGQVLSVARRVVDRIRLDVPRGVRRARPRLPR